MKKGSAFLIVRLYGSILLLHLIGHLTDTAWLQTLTKPLLIPVLAAFFLSCLLPQNRSLFLYRKVFASLFFAWLGDVFLIFSAETPFFFLVGLCAFLITQLLYSLSFLKVARMFPLQWNMPKLMATLSIVTMGGLLLTLLWPKLGTLQIPVMIYGCVITLMASLSLRIWLANRKSFSGFMLSGALLFMISDSILAINKFYSPIPEAGFWIMLTYGIAQYLIISGFIKYSAVTVVGAKQAPAE